MGRAPAGGPLILPPGDRRMLSGITAPFGSPPKRTTLSRSRGYVAHALLTLSPVVFHPDCSGIILTLRLACLNHAASVRSEPGSNPSVEFRVTTPTHQGTREWRDSRIQGLRISLWLFESFVHARHVAPRGRRCPARVTSAGRDSRLTPFLGCARPDPWPGRNAASSWPLTVNLSKSN